MQKKVHEQSKKKGRRELRKKIRQQCGNIVQHPVITMNETTAACRLI